MDLCERLEWLDGRLRELVEAVSFYDLDPATNEYPPAVQELLDRARGIDKLRCSSIMRMMDEQRLGEPEGSLR